MVRIDPQALYSKADLQELLGDLLRAEAFLSRLKPVRRFKNLYWGQDLLDALAVCSPLDEKRQSNAPLIPQRKEVKQNAQNHEDKNRLSLSEVLARRE